MSKDLVKLSNTLVIPKKLQSVLLLGKTLGKRGKKVLLDLFVPLTKDGLPKLATKATSSVLGIFEKKKNNRTRSSKIRKMIPFIYLK